MWFQAKKRTYLDYASATPVAPEALSATMEAFQLYGNPGAIHQDGVQAKEALTHAREKIALELGCKAREVVFVSGGTEANNLSILGVARKLLMKDALAGTHWMVSSMEHPSVLECFAEIERLGGEITHIDPDERGLISPEDVAARVRPQTVLISIGWVNHEIGTVQPLRAIVRAVRAKKSDVLVHTDAGQAPLYLHPQVHTLDVDLMSLDSGKLYGPRGIGAVYLSSRAELSRVLMGGGQERGLRAGTENVALAAGFAAAFSLIGKEREEEGKRLRILRNSLAEGITAALPEALINGALEHTVAHMLNISIPHIQTEYVTLALDQKGVSISTKSACREGEASRSHVVELLQGEPWRSEQTLRFSLGRHTRAEDIERAIAELSRIVARQRT